MDFTAYTACVARLLNNQPGVLYLTPDNRADLFRELIEEFEDAQEWEVALQGAHAVELKLEPNLMGVYSWVTYTQFNGE